MSWRTVVISSRCKLDYKMGFMVVRGEETKRVYIDEISIIIIENPAVSFTGCLIEELINKKVKVIFCDSERSPMAELVPYYGSYDCSRKIRAQQEWNDDIKGTVWSNIVAEKIKNQFAFLLEIGKDSEAKLLQSYISQIEKYDVTNREGHAAKVYFNALFGKDFIRSEENTINNALNYGYSILLSAFNREIVSMGYLTQIGLFHNNMFNFYNLSCDFMEPYRILIDRKVYEKKYDCFGPNEKYELVNILNEYVCIAGSNQTIINSIKIYARSIFEALNEGDSSRIKFYKKV